MKQTGVDTLISTTHIRAGGYDEASLVMSTMETGNTVANTVQTAQPAPAHHEDDGILAFFAIGIVINLVMITAYVIWAFRQWKKNRHTK